MKINRSSCFGDWFPSCWFTPLDSVDVEAFFLFQEVNAVLPTTPHSPTLYNNYICAWDEYIIVCFEENI